MLCYTINCGLVCGQIKASKSADNYCMRSVHSNQWYTCAWKHIFKKIHLKNAQSMIAQLNSCSPDHFKLKPVSHPFSGCMVYQQKITGNDGFNPMIRPASHLDFTTTISLAIVAPKLYFSLSVQEVGGRAKGKMLRDSLQLPTLRARGSSSIDYF